MNALAPRLRRLGLVIAMTLGLAACRMDLYTKQSELDANQMVAALQQEGVDAEKRSPDGGKSWSVEVEEDQIVRAMSVLRVHGLPQERHVNLGDLFKKDGLISTPTEERVRFIYGVTEELSETISHIDGVISARVHVVLPQNDPLAPTAKPSSASVFVKYRPEANVSALVPAIKNMVARGVEGLVYDNVSVTLVQGELLAPGAPLPAGHRVAWSALAAIVMMVLGGGVFVVLRKPEWLPSGVRARLPGIARGGPSHGAAEGHEPQPAGPGGEAPMMSSAPVPAGSAPVAAAAR